MREGEGGAGYESATALHGFRKVGLIGSLNFHTFVMFLCATPRVIWNQHVTPNSPCRPNINLSFSCCLLLQLLSSPSAAASYPSAAASSPSAAVLSFSCCIFSFSCCPLLQLLHLLSFFPWQGMTGMTSLSDPNDLCPAHGYALSGRGANAKLASQRFAASQASELDKALQPAMMPPSATRPSGVSGLAAASGI
eukprot:764266-Hanusia_phi.AAC.2